MAAVKPEHTAGAAVCGLPTAACAADCKQTPEAAGAAVCGSPTAACAAGCKQTPEVAGAASASGKAEQPALDEESEARRVERRARDDRAAWMRFHRSLETGNSKRKPRAEKCPDHIKGGIAQEPLKHGYYMDLWASQKESWGAVIAYERRYSLDVTGTKFTEQWLTAGQLMGIYQDKPVAQAHG